MTTRREEELTSDLLRMATENADLRTQISLLEQQVGALTSGLRRDGLVVKTLVGEPLHDRVSSLLVPVDQITLPDGGLLAVVTIGNDDWIPDTEEVEAIVEAVAKTLEDVLPQDRPHAVIGFAHGVKLDAFLVKGTEA